MQDNAKAEVGKLAEQSITRLVKIVHDENVCATERIKAVEVLLDHDKPKAVEVLAEIIRNREKRDREVAPVALLIKAADELLTFASESNAQAATEADQRGSFEPSDEDLL